MISHGFMNNVVDKETLSRAYNACLNFLDSDQHPSNYYPNINEQVNEVSDLIDSNIINLVSQLLNVSSPILMATELHLQSSGCPPIPPHQDNFYHCVDPDKGVKILIPFHEVNKDNGGLVFLDNDLFDPVMDHSPSSSPNFSSYIKSVDFKKLEFTSTSYSYQLGDLSYHFLNSIHYSYGNKTSKDIFFVVFRFQSSSASINEEAKKKYDLCYSMHKKILH